MLILGGVFFLDVFSGILKFSTLDRVYSSHFQVVCRVCGISLHVA